jgi:hypothetical protein
MLGPVEPALANVPLEPQHRLQCTYNVVAGKLGRRHSEIAGARATSDSLNRSTPGRMNQGLTRGLHNIYFYRALAAS